MTRGARAAAAGIALLSLAGCDRGEARGKTPLPPLGSTPAVSTTSPTTPTASPTPKSNREAADAFIREYFAEVDRAATTGKTARLADMADRKCKCQETVEFIDTSYRSGSVRGLKTSVDRVEFQLLKPDEVKLIVHIRITAYDVLDKSGRTVKRVQPVTRGVLAETLVKRGSRWIILAETVIIWER